MAALRSAIVYMVTMLLLAACGGGGGGDSAGGNSANNSGAGNPPSNSAAGNPPSNIGGANPPAPPSPPVSRPGLNSVVTAGKQVLLDGSASSVSPGRVLTYSWSFVGKPAGSAAALVGSTTANPTFMADQPGSYMLSLVVSDGRTASVPATVEVTAVALQIVLDQSEPVSGTVRLSLAGSVTGTVTWFVDLDSLGQGNSAPGNAIAWVTGTIPNGSHLIVARIQNGPNSFQDVRRTVSVANSSINLQPTISGTRGIISILVNATSAFGITSVSAQLDGQSLGTLTAPNDCGKFCPGFTAYRFQFDGLAVGSGSHEVVVTATDGSGASRQATLTATVSNAPQLTVSAPLDGAFAFGTVRVTGTTSSDKAGAVTTTASLGALQFLQTTASNFNGTFDLAGVIPGEYDLIVRATDSSHLVTQVSRKVVVASSGSLVYTPAFTLPESGRLLAAEGDKVLYSTPLNEVFLRDLSTGVEVPLKDSQVIQHLNDWQISQGLVYAFGQRTGCATSYCIYQWQPDGSIIDLSAADPYAAAPSEEHPVAKAGFVIWTDGATDHYTLYDVAARSYTKIDKPAGTLGVTNIDYDLAVVGGIVHFYFSASPNARYDIYEWRSDTGTSTRLTQDGDRNADPKTDGSRVVWQHGSNLPYTLTAQPVSGGTPTTLSTNVAGYMVRDGIIAWGEQGIGSRTIKAATADATVTLSSLNSSGLYATAGGQVIYAEAGKTYSWNSSTGATTLRIDDLPATLFATSGGIVFNIGTSVYRVPLN